MKKEFSCGIIPLRKTKSGWEVLLVRHGKAGHWAFPKGRQEKGEEFKETATRELKEETGCEVVEFLPFDPYEEHYIFRRKEELISKSVTYFAAIVTEEITLQQEEVTDHRWVSLKESENLATFAETKKLCKLLQSSL